MTELCIENEVKLISGGGPYAFDSDDAVKAVSSLRGFVEAAGMSCTEPQFIRLHDDYYSDAADTFRARGVIVRYRIKDGWKHTVVIKTPYIRTGLGLSRTEIETVLIGPRPDAVEDQCARHLGENNIDPVPKVSDDILRMRMTVTSEVRSYSLNFDRIIYYDPASKKRTVPGYEIELESKDKPIRDDQAVSRLINLLSGTGYFQEQKISKYARGRAWVDSLAADAEKETGSPPS